jgi:hypothetical protein
MSEFFYRLIHESGVVEPTVDDRKNIEDVFKATNLNQIRNIVRTGVYQIFGYKSDEDDPYQEIVLYVGKTKTRDVGIRVHEQLTDPNKTFLTNIKNAGYGFCSKKNEYDLLQEKENTVHVTRVEILVFQHSRKGEAGRDITEILLINSGEEYPPFNDEYTDSTPKKRSGELENRGLYKHTEYSGMSKEEMKAEGIHIEEKE